MNGPTYQRGFMEVSLDKDSTNMLLHTVKAVVGLELMLVFVLLSVPDPQPWFDLIQ